jgi:hypothetical protein
MTDPAGGRHELVVAAESWGLDGACYVSGFVIDVTVPLTEHMNQAVAASAQHRAVIEQAKGAIIDGLGRARGRRLPRAAAALEQPQHQDHPVPDVEQATLACTLLKDRARLLTVLGHHRLDHDGQPGLLTRVKPMKVVQHRRPGHLTGGEVVLERADDVAGHTRRQ